MNTAALKSFATAVRRQRIEAVTRKLDFALTAQTPAPSAQEKCSLQTPETFLEQPTRRMPLSSGRRC